MSADNPARIHALFRDAFNARDIEAVMRLYEPGAVLVVDGQPIAGLPAIRTAYEGFLARGPHMKLETRAVIQGEDLGLAVLHGAWTLEPPVTDGTGVVTRGLSTEVVRRQSDGTWLFVIDNPYTPEP